MPRFFITPHQIGKSVDGAETVLITGDDAWHISRSLRMRPGEDCVACDGNKNEYFCKIRSIGDSVTLDVVSKGLCAAEPPYEATVYQALVKGDRFDTVVQKSVECGAARIVPFISSRCIVRVDPKDAAKKTARWQRIAEEAAKQCGRGIIPKVCDVMSFGEALRHAAAADVSLFCYENENKNTLKQVICGARQDASIALMIGSEGGFSPDEAAAAAEAGIVSVGLGNRILRTETAAPFALACLSYSLEMAPQSL